ncbi:MAG: hypothetical protein ACOYJD_01920 [Christensenellales bacterium]
MDDSKDMRKLSKGDTSRLGWKVSPITGREYYDFAEVEEYELEKMLNERARRHAERQKDQKK